MCECTKIYLLNNGRGKYVKPTMDLVKVKDYNILHYTYTICTQEQNMVAVKPVSYLDG